MNVSIECGTIRDLYAIEQLYKELIEALEIGVNYPGWKKGIYPTRENAKIAIEDHSLFVARSKGKIVGSIILDHKAEQGYSSVKWQCEEDYIYVLVVHTLVVHPSFGNTGIGMQLMKYADKLAAEMSCKAIRLDVYEKNDPAIRLYERCGYQYIQMVDLGLDCFGAKWFKAFKAYEKLL